MFQTLQRLTSSLILTMAVRRLGSIEGLEGKTNDVIYCQSKDAVNSETTVYFGGDIQSYKEEMLAHRDNKHYVKWDLESTAVKLQDHFPTAEIIIVKPSKMTLNTFSCFENFVEVNNFGAPNHQISVDALQHLFLLLKNISTKIEQSIPDTCPANYTECSKPLKIVGFSKGCVVLNQLLFAFMALADNPNDELNEFVKRIKEMYWLEGGHSGISSTWVTDKAVLQNFHLLGIQVKIHVTPYQVMCDSRPRIGKEEKIFRETLRRLGTNIERTLHFEDEPRSLENHFRVLETFGRKSLT